MKAAARSIGLMAVIGLVGAFALVFSFLFLLYTFVGPYVGLNATIPKNVNQTVIVTTQSDEISKVAGLILTIEGILLGLSPLFFEKLGKAKLGASAMTVTAAALFVSLLTVLFADTNANPNILVWAYFGDILGLLFLVVFYVGSAWYVALKGRDAPKAENAMENMGRETLGQSGSESEKGGNATPSPECSSDKCCHGDKFDKEIELKKLDFTAEEHRARYYTAIGWHFTILIAVAAAIISLTVGLTINQVNTSNGVVSVPTPNFWYFFYDVVLGIFGSYVFTDTLGTIRKYRTQRPRMNELIKRIRNCRSIGTVEEALLFVEGKLVYQTVCHDSCSCNAD